MRALTMMETAVVFGGQDGPGDGYDGGPVPAGHTDVDGTGRFMRNSRGVMSITPGYAGYLNSNSSRINWGGVAADISQIAGGSFGFLPVGQLASWVSWGIVSFSELYKQANKRSIKPTTD